MSRIREIINKIIETFTKGSLQTKLIIGGIGVLILAAGIFTLTYSTPSTESLLFQRALSLEEYGAITLELENMGVDFRTRDDKYVLVKDEDTKRQIKMKLAQNGKFPNSIKGWELFDMQSWTTTEFDRSVNLRRALVGEMKRHIESLEWIERANVTLTMPKRELYTEKIDDVTAAVSILPAPGFYENLKNKSLIKGIQLIIQKGVDGLKEENITITDHTGLILETEQDDVEKHIRQAKEENRIIQRQRLDIERKLQSKIEGILPRDRYRVAAALELDFDRLEQKVKELLPMVVKARTPGIAYDDSVVIEKIPVSDKNITEEFKGQGFIPEGPPGQEPNIPPGYKEIIDKWNTYAKNEKINNWETGEKISQIVKDSQDIIKKSVSIAVDGTWEREVDEKGNYIWDKDRFRRKYIPYPEDELKKLEQVVRGAIGFNRKRGDEVFVRNIQFDRTKEFQAADEKYRRQQQIRVTLLIILGGASFLFIAWIIYYQIRKEIIRQRRLRERELQRQRQMQRDEALRALETDYSSEAISEADRKHQELQERADHLAMERPRDVAKLVQSWLAEDN